METVRFRVQERYNDKWLPAGNLLDSSVKETPKEAVIWAVGFMEKNPDVDPENVRVVQETWHVIEAI